MANMAGAIRADLDAINSTSWKCYIIHFGKKFHHARHYIGITASPLGTRLLRHNNGGGARITAAAVKAGISLDEINLLGTYCSASEAREAEKLFKKKAHHNKNWNHRICPVCNADLEAAQNG